MADKYYAWSTFRLGVNEWGQVTETLDPGEEVTKDKLGVSDEEWQSLIDSGSIRTDEYPSDLPPGVSPAKAPKPKREEESAIRELRLTPQEPPKEATGPRINEPPKQEDKKEETLVEKLTGGKDK